MTMTMTMTSTMALTWMAALGALATAVAALELLAVRHVFSDAGVFRRATLRASIVFSAPGTLAILALQLASALALPWLDHPAPAWVAFTTTLLVAIRFRGSYNGGSDSMLLVVLLALALARTAPASRLALGALGYAAAQLVLSYFLAGLAKLRDPRWRDGTALPILVALPHYGVPAPLRALLSRPRLARVAGAAMLAFECSFPLALVRPEACFAYLAFGATFHLVNAVAFGLNRFLWTWLAAYPALIFWVERARD